MNPQRIFGLLLLVVGLVLLFFGLNATDSVADTLSEGFTGKYTDKTMWYIVGGAAMGLVGLGLLVAGRGRIRSA